MMKLILIIFPFILFNYDVGIARMTDNEPGLQTQGIEEVDREWNAEDREYGELYCNEFSSFNGKAFFKSEMTLKTY